eukprot:12780707-Alexandrium_andersonii.AAC.1
MPLGMRVTEGPTELFGPTFGIGMHSIPVVVKSASRIAQNTPDTRNGFAGRSYLAASHGDGL